MTNNMEKEARYMLLEGKIQVPPSKKPKKKTNKNKRTTIYIYIYSNHTYIRKQKEKKREKKSTVKQTQIYIYIYIYIYFFKENCVGQHTREGAPVSALAGATDFLFDITDIKEIDRPNNNINKRKKKRGVIGISLNHSISYLHTIYDPNVFIYISVYTVVLGVERQRNVLVETEREKMKAPLALKTISLPWVCGMEPTSKTQKKRKHK
eukprot:gene6956-4922_t